MAQSPIPAQPYYPQIDKSVDPKVTVHLQRVYPALNDHDKAITNLKAQLNSLADQQGFTIAGSSVTKTPSASSSSSTTTGVTAAQAQSIASNQVVTQVPTIIQNTLGNVNAQTATAYTIQSNDYGGVVSFNNAAATTATLNPNLNARFFTAFENLGAGTVTLQPGTGVGGTGTINGLANLPLATGEGALVYYDGTNWTALPIGASGGGGGVISLDGITGAITLIGGAGITITDNTPAAGDITIAATAVAGVTSLQTETGAITLTSSGATVVITTPTSSTINLESTGGGGGLPTNNPTFTGLLSGPAAAINHLENTGTSPTVALHGAAGSGASSTIGGNDTFGQIQITAGSGASAGFIATITLSSAFTSSTFPMVVGFNNATSVIESFAAFPSGSGGSWQLNAGFAMTSGQIYNIQYVVFGQ